MAVTAANGHCLSCDKNVMESVAINGIHCWYCRILCMWTLFFIFKLRHILREYILCLRFYGIPFWYVMSQSGRLSIFPIGRSCVCVCSGLICWVLSGCAIWRLKFFTHWATSVTMSVIWWSTWVARRLATSMLHLRCRPRPSSSRQSLSRHEIMKICRAAFAVLCG